ncbi:hypothetical protein DAI22_01g189550 [Oryza sativa Japonica Group]|nr:hypothetical protein DAI22_01g189550 [Oryza sativa Japonica Group]
MNRQRYEAALVWFFRLTCYAHSDARNQLIGLVVEKVYVGYVARKGKKEKMVEYNFLR